MYLEYINFLFVKIHLHGALIPHVYIIQTQLFKNYYMNIGKVHRLFNKSIDHQFAWLL